MTVGVIGNGRDQSFFMKVASALFGMPKVPDLKGVAHTPFISTKKEKRRNKGGRLNQRQIRKRAAQGCKVRQECRLKQRGRR
jgi:hypothetical protein